MKICDAMAGAALSLIVSAPMLEANAAITDMAGDEIQIEDGKSYLNNNQWGAADIDEGWQHVFYQSAHNLGWRWHWPSTVDSVKAYPSLVTGWHWSSRYSPNSQLPIALSAVHHIRTRAHFEAAADGRYTIAYDVWCHSTSPARWYSSPTAEVMIWLYQQDVHPAGDYRRSVTIEGNRWRLYTGMLPSRWPIYTFVLENGSTDVAIDLQPLLAYLSHTGLWNKNARFLSGIEFGTEIYSGTGEVHLRDWSLDVN